MPIAREGLREILIATVALGAGAAAGFVFYWPAAIPFIVLWIWVISFFRDPKRNAHFRTGELCAPADGTVTEITELTDYQPIGGPAGVVGPAAVRIGIFLSLFDVHINRVPCSGRIRALAYRPGEYLDARHPEAGRRNESNNVLIEPDAPMPGPVEVRQIAGLVARRIVCHASLDQHLPIGTRFGLIKFGSRTELIIPRVEGTEVLIKVGDMVRAGLTVVARQPITASIANEPATSKLVCQS